MKVYIVTYRLYYKNSRIDVVFNSMSKAVAYCEKKTNKFNSSLTLINKLDGFERINKTVWSNGSERYVIIEKEVNKTT